MNSTLKTKQIAINGMCIVLIFIVTMCINVPMIGNGGVIHLGDVPLFLAAIIFGKKTGAIAGAFGMGLFDLISGWTAWAPFTFIIVGFMGFVVGLITEKESHNNFIWYSLAIFLALIITVVGYYIAEVILYGNLTTPITSIPGNIMQVLAAGVVVIPIAKTLKKIIRIQILGGRNL